jgi:cell wall-associated NlpC family hydrolase
MPPSLRPVLRSAIVLIAASLIVSVVLPGGSPAASASQVTDKQAEAQQIADSLDGLNAKLMSLANQSEVARQHLAEANHGVDSARARVDAANADIDTAKGQLTSFAVSAYVAGNDGAALDVSLSSQPNDVPVKTGYMQTLSGNRADLLDQLASAKKNATDEGARLQEQVDAAQVESDRIDSAQREADAAVAQQTQLKSQIDTELAGLVAAEQARRDQAAQQLAQQTAQAAAAQAAAAKTTAPAENPPPGIAPSPTPPTTITPGPIVAPNGRGAQAVAAAMSKLGAKYVWGAAGPDTFDCSGLTLWAWAHAGVSLPHYTGSQLAVTRPIPISALQPGDLVFVWGPGESGDPGHVGLYIGGGQMVHAPNSGSWVKVDSIYWWSGARIAAGRVG